MTLANWIMLGITLVGWAVTYGALRQKVSDLSARNSELNTRVGQCEDRHGKTSDRIGAMELDMAVLKERSGTTITTLNRIESKLEVKARAARRAAS
jgi:outer membrane murein-binding lipoprotein Lpp